jgi:hypothetical protein
VHALLPAAGHLRDESAQHRIPRSTFLPPATGARRYVMNIRQLQLQAYREWKESIEIKCHYHTFEHYWQEKYARVYRLPAWAIPVKGFMH